MSGAQNFTVSFYQIDRAYGGPEEGGWWYDCGQLVRIARVFKTQERAIKWARRANHILRIIQQGPGVSSVAYRGDHYLAEVREGVPEAYYPTETPFYE